MKTIFAKLVYWILAIGVIAAAGSFLYHSKIFASDLGGGDQKTLDLGLGLGHKNVRLTISNGNGKIEVTKNMFSGCESKLTGFQNEAKIRGTVSFGENLKAVEVFADVGAHSENRQYFIIDKNFCPKPISFVKNNLVSYNVYSDEPSFLLQDYNGDGVTDLAVEYRNYDLNPIIDGMRDIYFFDLNNNKFEFSRTDKFQYIEID